MTRPLGRSGVAATALGFGAASIGNLYREVSDEQAASAVQVGAGKPEHIQRSAEWMAAPPPPAQLWTDLVDAGLLRPDAVTPAD